MEDGQQYKGKIMTNFEDVKIFMEKFGQIVRTKPQFPDNKTMQLRFELIKEELDEYYLRETGMASGQLGSMNLSNPDKNVIYSSSILGNNFGLIY